MKEISLFHQEQRELVSVGLVVLLQIEKHTFLGL